MQLKINASQNIIFEWIPFEQFNDVKEIKNDDLTSISSAIWKNGQLYYDNNKYEYARNQNTKVILKYLYNSQNISNVFLNKVKSYYSINRNSYMPEVKSSTTKTYGVTQNLDTKDYIIVSQNECCFEKCGKLFTDINLKWCKQCYSKTIIIWTSGNEKIDNLIQEIQSKINMTFEWIPYNHSKLLRK
ncbi:unnamed protein product [Rhizophagus irregularis]|nr:unnamed protein product [Rhizophagus irregularis]